MASKEVTNGASRRPPNAGKGRKKGTPNKVTASIKAAICEAFDRVRVGKAAGGVDSLVAWGNEKPDEFYKLWARLAPTEVTGPEGGPLTIRIVRDA